MDAYSLNNGYRILKGLRDYVGRGGPVAYINASRVQMSTQTWPDGIKPTYQQQAVWASGPVMSQVHMAQSACYQDTVGCISQ